jgi:hypothetical protein
VCYAIQGDLYALLYDPVASAIKMADVQTSEMDEKFAPINVGP